MVGGTHCGQREHNEDCFLADSTRGLALVADGMGGYACGEVASDIVRQALQQGEEYEPLPVLIKRADDLIRQAVLEDPEKTGMGSTVVAFRACDTSYQLAWVGDSRAYLWDGQLKQLTRDHSHIELLLSRALINEAEAACHPKKHVITQAVGACTDKELQVDTLEGRLARGEQILLCSDGLIDQLSDGELAAILAAAETPQLAIDQLIAAALEAGARDNITAVLVTALQGRSANHVAPVAIASPGGERIRPPVTQVDGRFFAKAWGRLSWLALTVLLVAVVAWFWL